MRILIGALLAGALILLAYAQPASTTKETNLRTQTEFDLHVSAPYAAAASLFGPEGERAWAGEDWNPNFIYPQPAADTQGAVFTINHGSHTATWVNTLFDIEARHFHYVYFIPGIMVTEIDVRFKTPSEMATDVHVVYTRTALTTEGNEHVKAMTEHDKSAGTEWQRSIDRYLALGKVETPH